MVVMSVSSQEEPTSKVGGRREEGRERRKIRIGSIISLM